MIDCLSTRSPFGPIGTGKGGPAFEATAGHFGFSMPRFSAEQLARAAEAGAPKANSEFADVSEWQADQTEWLGIFSPDEQVPSVRDPQRRVVWMAKRALLSAARRGGARSGGHLSGIRKDPISSSNGATSICVWCAPPGRGERGPTPLHPGGPPLGVQALRHLRRVESRCAA